MHTPTRVALSVKKKKHNQEQRRTSTVVPKTHEPKHANARVLTRHRKRLPAIDITCIEGVVRGDDDRKVVGGIVVYVHTFATELFKKQQ